LSPLKQAARSAATAALITTSVTMASAQQGVAAEKATQIIARAPLGATPAAERLLAASAEPRRLKLVAGDDTLSVARRTCGRLTETFVQLLGEANISVPAGEAVIPACFVTRLDQRVKVDTGETWRRLANRTSGTAGLKTLSGILTSNAAAASADGSIWTVAASKIPRTVEEVTVPVTTEPVVYRPRPGVEAERLADDLRAALGTAAPVVTVATTGDEFTLEAGVAPALAAPTTCRAPATPIVAWPFDVAEVAAVMARNRSRIGVGTPTTIAVIDNGIDGVMTAAFPIEEFAANQLELANPNDGVDQDGDDYFDDVVGTNIYDQGPPAAFPQAIYPAHGSMMASLALGGGDYRAWRRATGVAPSVRLRVVSIVRRSVAPSPQGNVTRYSLPTEALGRAVTYAETGGATILNLSVSTPNRLQEVEDALYNRANLLLVVAAGNAATDLDSNDRFPAALSRDNSRRGRVVTVAAHNQGGCLSRFSGHGAETVDFASPGERIRATGLSGTEVVDEGTSQATAITSFVAGQLRASGLTLAAAIKERLLASVDLDPAYRGLVRSEGRLNVAKALSVSDDVLELAQGTARLYGRLTARPGVHEVCPALPASTGVLLKVSRRIDGGSANEVRLLVRIRANRGETKILHCVPDPGPMTLTTVNGQSVTFHLSDVGDLVPSV